MFSHHHHRRHRRLRFSFASIFARAESNKTKLTKLEKIKLLVSLALPLAIGLFTVITTIQNRSIARQERHQDIEQSEDEQRETVFVNYINDITRFRDQNINVLNHTDKLIYIQAKTLTALRTLDIERKKFLLLFLQDSSLLPVRNDSIFSGANFNGIELNGDNCRFFDVFFSGFYFENVSFISCIFQNVTFHQCNFKRARLTRSTFHRSHFIGCQMDYVNFEHAMISEVNFQSSTLIQTDFRRSHFERVNFSNVMLTEAILSDNFSSETLTIRNSLLPNGTLTVMNDLSFHDHLCQSLNTWNFELPNSILIDNCSFVSTIPNAIMDQNIPIAIHERSVFIDANQTEFQFQLRQNDTNSTILYCSFERKTITFHFFIIETLIYHIFAKEFHLQHRRTYG